MLSKDLEIDSPNHILSDHPIRMPVPVGHWCSTMVLQKNYEDVALKNKEIVEKLEKMLWV